MALPALSVCEHKFPTLPPSAVRGSRAVNGAEDVTLDIVDTYGSPSNMVGKVETVDPWIQE